MLRELYAIRRLSSTVIQKKVFDKMFRLEPVFLYQTVI